MKSQAQAQAHEQGRMIRVISIVIEVTLLQYASHVLFLALIILDKSSTNADA